MAANARFLSRVQIVDFDEAAIQRYLELKKQKIKVRTNDLRIAATALVQDATIVTRNVRDFQQVPGLKVEDWSK